MDRYAKYYPRFSEGEYARRYDEIRRMMVERNISSLIIHGDSMKSNRMQANVRYITNFVDEVVSYVFFPLEGELTQWMDLKHHLTNARAVSVI
ncbi:MAG TPA: hypothetical protein VJZ75_10655, partial [Candidatus Bathyarchaeia archaeon]|nr:hypothetical protein [Candidatus Bathyarchaeia archaeon]